MKFQLAINLERSTPDIDMAMVRDHTLAMVKMADEAGFEIVWAAEHHALEMTIAPDPFQLLTWWAGHTHNIRLGSGVANAAYWHPIKIAGAAAMLDLVSGGRLEFGLGSGAYQREFDRCILVSIRKTAIDICRKCCLWYSNYGKAMSPMTAPSGSSRRQHPAPSRYSRKCPSGWRHDRPSPLITRSRMTAIL